jgi:hypothetical protein
MVEISVEGKIGILLALLGLAGAGAIMVYPAYTSIGWGLIAIAIAGSIGLVFVHLKEKKPSWRIMEPSYVILFGLAIALAGLSWQTFWPPLKAAAKVPPIAVTAAPMRPFKFYAAADKARIAEALYELSEILNKTGSQMSERAQAAVSASDGRVPSDAKVVLGQFEQLSLAFNRSFDFNVDGLLVKYQAYGDDIREVIQGNKYEELSRELLSGIRILLNTVSLLQKCEGREAESLRDALGVLATNVSKAEMGFRNWRHETNKRIDEFRRSLGAQHSDLGLDVVDGGTF